MAGSTPSSPSPMALFRFSVVSLMLSWLLRGEVRARAVEAVAAQEHATPWGEVRRVSPRTVYRWLAAYEQHGLDGLEPATRPRTDSSVVLPDAFVSFLRSEKKADPRASSPELIRRARERRILSPQTQVDRTTVWRACRRMDLPTRRRPHKREADTRRFAFPHRMMMVLADGKQFRAGAARLKRVALVFLDDCTRYVRLSNTFHRKTPDKRVRRETGVGDPSIHEKKAMDGRRRCGFMDGRSQCGASRVHPSPVT